MMSVQLHSAAEDDKLPNFAKNIQKHVVKYCRVPFKLLNEANIWSSDIIL